MIKKAEKFADIKVETPDIDELKSQIGALQKKLEEAQEPAAAIGAVKEYFALTDEFNSVAGIISIHFTQDTNNEEYRRGQELIDDIAPLFTEAANAFEKAILSSPHIKELIAEFGDLFIRRLELDQQNFDPSIVEDLQEENKLSSQYGAIIAGAKIEFDGQTYNLPQMARFLSSPDRDVRRRAAAARWKFVSDNDEKIGSIFDKLVKVRTKMAKKLGHETFTPVGYGRLGRLGYGPDDVAQYREQILKFITPLSEKHRKLQMERLGIADPHYYDYSVYFLDGNPKPSGDTAQLTDAAEEMYHQMKPEIGEYFTYLKKHGQLDLEARTGKQSGGYEEYIPALKSPFIFSNFNGTDADVQVLTHEFGHALQGFLGSDFIVPSYRSPGYECCEMHSMSMEYIAYPYLGKFFEEKDLKKYRFQHIIDAIFFLPYGVAVDEFQHRIYEKPELTHTERKAVWREIEKKYLPYRQYGADSDFLENGGFFMTQAHIFQSPFYYIDYTIAQVVSLEFLVDSQKDFDSTLDKYLDFCKLGGSLDYHELLLAGRIKDPMKVGVIEKLIPEVLSVIEKYQAEVK